MNLGSQEYYPQTRKLMMQALSFNERQAVGFFGANAARLVGLNIVNGLIPKTRTRLEKFYDQHGRDKSILAMFDS